ncbi:hypothetical protein BMG00_16085 [Thioclava marina]|uniref:Sulfotransferase family protein n=1 Tax=Thioclava marina TaxID=1915077 RepID=A0ABX3MIG2_9RHOB|nr:sulfotransferase family 2 domain-containing protein [Thioclava marina]OOY11246.1 hypothetical protein BMG00_16085 [Thioclava marina]
MSSGLPQGQRADWHRESGGAVGRLRRVRERVLDRAIPQRFVFHHVPKCGGTSVGRALRKRCILSQGTVLPEASYRAFEAFMGQGDTERMLVDVLDLREQMLLYLMFADTRCISAHVRFSETAYERFAERYKFITILREPVSRFLSHYAFSHGRSGAHAEIRERFDAFLDTPRAARLGASYVEFFSGLPKEADLSADASIDKAIAALSRFAVVGRLDDQKGFAEAIRRELALRVRIGHENRAGGARPGLRAHDLSEAQLTRVRALCAPDLAVWEAAP